MRRREEACAAGRRPEARGPRAAALPRCQGEGVPPPHAHSTRANVITHSYERHTHAHARACPGARVLHDNAHALAHALREERPTSTRTAATQTRRLGRVYSVCGMTVQRASVSAAVHPSHDHTFRHGRRQAAHRQVRLGRAGPAPRQQRPLPAGQGAPPATRSRADRARACRLAYCILFRALASNLGCAPSPCSLPAAPPPACRCLLCFLQ